MDEMNIEEETEMEEEIGGEWWSWGAGTDGQLGTGRLDDEHLPQRLPDLSSGRRISQLACGGAHVIALSGGDVMTWGRGTSGQLGHGELESCLLPKPVKFLENFTTSYVSAGWNHSGFVSDTGKLFTCGDGSFGQLGHGDYQSHCSPVEVLYFAFKHVEQIACGMRHSLVLLKGSSEDPVYGFGSGKRGQLGVSKDRIRSFAVPQVIFGLGGIKVISISANGDHSAALSANGQLYTWGRGFGGTSDIHLPQTLPSPLRFSQVALGWNHALLLTGEGEVLMLGGNHHGMLSDPQTSRQQHSPVLDSSSVGSAEDSMGLILAKVCGLDGTRVLEIAAGAEHSVLVTENGVVMTWGWGEHGQLGLGNTFDQTSPQMVKLSDGHNRFRVYCGSGFTYAYRILLS
ncbi:PREDICTED: ultraviolet-B receptor UVR8 isoform X1 [Nelumbo nucifera]|uniref:Ultraviolet-B receptor UVR8 isoform X1 n=2 Tax=Nelumbo nucifera TaxID=4432 RepID=A0A1U8Q0F5_NELNU|nr:PREDICTED: ultraviolet-B receptor UVR8 isoform X1 [Nelumbo nucifera]